jgi:aryl-phospho-beta-D-glucosidase BglC (GH1 family)
MRDSWSYILIAVFVCFLLNLCWREQATRNTILIIMKSFLGKAKSALEKHRPGQQNQEPLQEGPSQIQPPSPADVSRYHYHHGTNIGSVFVLEKWLTGSMFLADAKGKSELAAVEARVNAEGIDGARQRHEKHWREYVSDTDLDWLRDVARCNSVRLPVGYYVLGPPYCKGTPFEKVAPVYQNAWKIVKELIQRCSDRGISVVIDMHGLPGGANAQDHSGTDIGKAELWTSKDNRELATRALCFVAQQVKNLDGVAAIQIINEAEWNAKGMYDWYDAVISELSRIDPSMPVYISDAWNLGPAAKWSQKHNSVGSQTNPVAVDTHKYWCFADHGKTPQGVISDATTKLSALDGKDGAVVEHGASQAIVGEYSCVLGEKTWAQGGDISKEELVRQFGNAQSKRFQQRAGGSFFWTYRMDWMPGGEWGFKNMVEKGAITAPVALTLEASDVQNRLANAQSQQQERKNATVSGHCNYWDSKHPGEYEHWRFEQGWDVGFNDALSFFGSRSDRNLPGAETIGMLDLWVLKRLRESGQGGKFVWEFEQGLRQGIRDFQQSVGV